MYRLINQIACATLLLTGSAVAIAQEHYPNRPIRIVVNSAPGALLDITTRAVAQQMAENLRRPVVIDNRPGADGQIGIRAAKAAPADGYTLLASANTVAQLPAMKKDPGYALKDFVGIGMMNEAPLLMVTSPSLPYRSVADLTAAAQARPGKLSYASGGSGTTTHVAAAILMHQGNLDFVHVPYKGIAPAMSDVIAGRVDFAFDGGNSSGPQVKDGRLRALGVTSAKRSPAFPDIPTLAEQGLAGYSYTVYLGLLAPAGTPKEIVQRLSQALLASLASAPVRERFRRDGAEPGTMTPEAFTRFLQQDLQRTMKIVADLKLEKE
ncbi:tripartite tricarboxylate transporter substrate binding protein (plasmid) [Cupriavidus pinatubonensis]|uniref:Bug family tripartite tricarboxylate transporter substrate binding protein n=1 Tax=Cupriavidus pinatubonensis TaxID=248026 RepID=UPI001C72B1BA|nr:tripartite tricarboxylate transporter substrate binding protein [Cupriavidus pinatubonensis]QYY33934.1 tripartite tricarboxylate transporter substrate binding protein [Cupriavidus pinatubonensis]